MVSVTIQSITSKTLKNYFDTERSFVLFDVREPSEFEICQIDGSILVPFSELQDHLPDFDKDKEYIVYCKTGTLSVDACKIMKKQGFKKVRYLKDGIYAWIDQIETYLEKY
jgi:adenylyltransferase/sulfurtransferase